MIYRFKVKTRTVRDIHSSVHPTRPCSHVIQAFFPQVPFFQSASPFNIFGSFFFGSYHIMRLSVLPGLFVYGLPLLGLWFAFCGFMVFKMLLDQIWTKTINPVGFFHQKWAVFEARFFPKFWRLIGFMVCLFWVHGLPLLGSWFASSGFMVCLLWVYGLPFVGSGSAFCGFGVCLFWVHGPPLLAFVDLWFVFSGFMVWLLRVHGFPRKFSKDA